MNIAQILAVVEANISTIALGVVLAQLSIVILLVVMYRSLSAQRKKFQQLTSGQNGKSLEAVLMQYATEVNVTRTEIKEIARELHELDQKQQSSYQKLAFIRYNALPDVRGELSFSFAMLDNHDSGVLLSSIYGREEARVYGKVITSGQATSSLSKEEQRVLEQAIKGVR